jgi:hypothetical protein
MFPPNNVSWEIPALRCISRRNAIFVLAGENTLAISEMKWLSHKWIRVIALPLFAVFLQAILRFSANHDFNTVGITLASIGLGQLLPFIMFDHLLVNRVFKPKTKITSNSPGKIEFNVELSEIQGDLTEHVGKQGSMFLIAALISLLLFSIVILLGIKGFIITHILLGLGSCVASWLIILDDK